MAGVVPVVPPRTGSMEGKLYVETERFITFDEVCTHLPLITSFFDELDKQGRRYFYIDGHGKVIMELDIETAPYAWQTQEHLRGGFAYKLTLDFERRLPKLKLKNIVSLDRCVANISSRDHVRGVTVDLTANKVTYVHDCLWLSKGKGCTREAKDVLKILKWLVEDKKFKLDVAGGKSYYKELIALMGGK